MVLERECLHRMVEKFFPEEEQKAASPYLFQIKCLKNKLCLNIMFEYIRRCYVDTFFYNFFLFLIKCQKTTLLNPYLLLEADL